MKKSIFVIGVVVVILAVIYGIFWHNQKNPAVKTVLNPPALTNSVATPVLSNTNSSLSAETITPTKAIVGEPITDALSRITKKPFGIYVSPGHSPISPERFTGYHTGVDFETLPSEQNSDVFVSAICDGTVLVKKTATGYGGVIVASCVLSGAPVTVVYGHLALTSIGKKVGDKLSQGEKIGVLGIGYSAATDGERKHLHLGIHKGSNVDILGYVQKQADLKQWINVVDYLK